MPVLGLGLLAPLGRGLERGYIHAADVQQVPDPAASHRPLADHEHPRQAGLHRPGSKHLFGQSRERTVGEAV